MTNQELYKQAILDAKAVRETALAAAKDSLAEAFEPRIKEMLRMKLSEELEEDLQEKADMEEAADMEESADMEETMDMEEGADMEEATLEEILAELNAISEEMEEGTMEEAKMKKGDKMEEGMDPNMEEAEEKEDDEATEDDEEGEAAGMEGEADDDEKVVSITVGELKDIFRDVMSQVQGGGAPEMGAPGMASSEEEEGMMGELSLEEILAELEEDEKMEEAVGGYKMGKDETTTTIEEKKKASKEEEKTKKELEEAKKAINVMRAELQEVNLLNAKLLYVNKLWKAKSLNESQKVKVLNAFDRATTVKEAENIFKTLSESLVATKKADLKESMGFASKPIGSAPAKPIVEADEMVSRWKTLAGIK